jgi:hypothetical protein
MAVRPRILRIAGIEKDIYSLEHHCLRTSDPYSTPGLVEHGGKNMPSVKKPASIEPLPRYIMPDASVPAYDEIMEQLQEYHRTLIGTSYYYIRAENDRTNLCRIVPGAGKLFFHEIVDHEKHGISEDDLEEAVSLGEGAFTTPGYYPVSGHIEAKLRVVLE